MEETPFPAPGTPDAADKELEHDDPYELVGVRFPMPSGVDVDREVARCFVEDYALMGWSPEQVRRLFTDQFFRGTHAISERSGSDLVEELIAEVFVTTEGAH